MNPRIRKAALVLLPSIVLLFAGTAHAQLVLSFQQDGSDVTITANGSVDLNGLSFFDTFGSAEPSILNTDVFGRVWSDLSSGDAIYFAPEPFFLFSNPFPETPGIATGDPFGFGTANLDSIFGSMAGDAFLYFENGFAGGAIDGTLTVPDATLASLGLNEGVISWGPSADQSLTITTIIPEPSSLALLGLGGVLLAPRRR